MIRKLVLKNFKSIEKQEFEFTDFDLLVGANNTGKSTVLQALAIWQYCIFEFQRVKRSGSSGIQVVLPNFSALPVPEFNLLWKDRTERRYHNKPDGGKRQEYITIDIDLNWSVSGCASEQSFGVKLRYSSPQAIYAIPSQGWDVFGELDLKKQLPVIVYVPPFSGLEPEEEWRDTSVINKQVGKAQPGSVLRNLLLSVHSNDSAQADWSEIGDAMSKWFSVELLEPQYRKGVDTLIKCEYKQGKKSYDIIAGGSGFHQALTLLAFLYGYRPTTILLDEPDAHLHVNLQREMLDFFLSKTSQLGTQFIVATHAEALIEGVHSSKVVSLQAGQPKRNPQVENVLDAMAIVSNLEASRLRETPLILYLEGDSDERLLRVFSQKLGQSDWLQKAVVHYMGGGSKPDMKKRADSHFRAAREIIPGVKRLMLFDYDVEDTFHPDSTTEAVFEWTRKNIENYLLVDDAWLRFGDKSRQRSDDLFDGLKRSIVGEFFASQNLQLPPKANWKNVDAEVFKVIDGKKLLFSSNQSLRAKLSAQIPELSITPEAVAQVMNADELHSDIEAFFAKLARTATST